MCGMLRLHRETTYHVPADAQPSDVVRAEEARRTLWMMGLLRNLFAGNYSPVPFALNELTALLPAEEQDAAFAVVPSVRAALPYSQAAVDHPALGAADCPARSLFGTVIQAYQLWGRVARGACLGMDRPGTKRDATRTCPSSPPAALPLPLWDSDSAYSKQTAALADWEDALSRAHAWSPWNLRVYRAQGLDIAFASIFVALRLCNIVVRCSYLAEIRRSLSAGDAPTATTAATTAFRSSGTDETPRAAAFWKAMAADLFANVLALHEGIALLLDSRPSSQGFPPLLPFALYSCGSLAMQLCRFPPLCPEMVHRAPGILARAKADLLGICATWPIAAHWHSTLETAADMLPSSPPLSGTDARTQTPPAYECPPPSLDAAATTPASHAALHPRLVDSTADTIHVAVASPASPATWHSLCLPFESARYPGTIMLGHEPDFAPEDSISASWMF